MADPGLLDVIAGWGLPDGVIDHVEPLRVERDLSLVAEHHLTGVVHAAMHAGDLEVDRPDQVDEAYRQAMASNSRLEANLLNISDVLGSAGIDHAVLRGIALADRAGPAAHRVCRGLDLLVRPGMLPEAVLAMEHAGAVRTESVRSSTWERRVAASVPLAKDGDPLNLHRTLAPGPFGVAIADDRVFADVETFAVAERSLSMLSVEHHLLHVAMHVALARVRPRLGDVRDVALLLSSPGLDADRLVRTVVDWGVSSPFATGVLAADAVGAEANGLVEWARRHRDCRRDRWLRSSYAEGKGQARRQAIATLSVLGWRDRVAFLRSR